MKKRHSLEPIIPPNPRILILGSMPGEMSLKLKQYYGHKTNQFWKIVATLLGVKIPTDYCAKKKMLHEGRIALWDVLKSCHRNGSSDASIEKTTTNDILKLLKQHKTIRSILLNGRTAERCFKENIARHVKIPYHYVPSTSSAHAGLTFAKKLALWKKALGLR